MTQYDLYTGSIQFFVTIYKEVVAKTVHKTLRWLEDNTERGRETEGVNLIPAPGITWRP